jgi:hypothetical protein
MIDDEYQAAVSTFICAKGVTRCPTACSPPTQGTVDAADRVALEGYAIARDQTRRKRLAARDHALRDRQLLGE